MLVTVCLAKGLYKAPLISYSHLSLSFNTCLDHNTTSSHLCARSRGRGDVTGRSRILVSHVTILPIRFQVGPSFIPISQIDIQTAPRPPPVSGVGDLGVSDPELDFLALIVRIRLSVRVHGVDCAQPELLGDVTLPPV